MPALPDVPPPFEWRNEPWGPALSCQAVEHIAHHLFTSRHLRLSSEDGWTAVAASMGVPVDRVCRLRQVHGPTVILARSGVQGMPPDSLEGDALISDDPAVAIAVKAADCVPILLADRRTGVVGAVHAGWRGTAAGIVAATVTAMQDTFGTNPADLVAAIGPSIQPCCYEVGPELVDAFAAQGHARHLVDRWFVSLPPRRGERGLAQLRLDLSGANRDQLALAGVPERQIHLSGLCTANHLEVLTSFRAEREHAGRLAGVIRARGGLASVPQ